MINLEENLMDLDGAIAIITALSNTKVRELNLQGNKLYFTGAPQLIEAIKTQHLHTLALTMNEVENLDALRLNTALNRTSLYQLKLKPTSLEVTQHDIHALLASLENTPITSLSFPRTRRPIFLANNLHKKKLSLASFAAGIALHGKQKGADLSFILLQALPFLEEKTHLSGVHSHLRGLGNHGNAAKTLLKAHQLFFYRDTQNAQEGKSPVHKQ